MIASSGSALTSRSVACRFSSETDSFSSFPELKALAKVHESTKKLSKWKKQMQQHVGALFDATSYCEMIYQRGIDEIRYSGKNPGLVLKSRS